MGEREGAAARPAIGPGLASPAGRHRRHFPASASSRLPDTLTGLAAAVKARCKCYRSDRTSTERLSLIRRRRRRRRRRVLHELEANHILAS